MNRAEILEFLNANPVCRLATLDGDQPRVRGMLLYRADQHGLIFHTGGPKDIVRQLSQNPKVEICFNNADSSIQVRVAGRGQFAEDKALKEEIVAARPFLKPIVQAHGDAMLKVFRVTDCQATVWTMATNMERKTLISL